MRLLTLNCGSSSLKFDVLDVPAGGAAATGIASGAVDGIGGKSSVSFLAGNERPERSVTAEDHREAFSAAMGLLREASLLSGIEAVGHRVVHGGARFREAARIDDAAIEAIRAVSDLAPLHNRPALEVIEAAREVFSTELPMAAAFDTAFYAALPESAARYAIPKELAVRHGIRRFGFHGLAHSYMVRRFRELRPDVDRPRLVTLQLGSGCSATASIDGRPVDTSMGYTPLEGLIMATRSGDLDPALPLRLQALTGMTAGEVETMLNGRSGLLGLSGRTSDMRELLAAAEAGDDDCEIAVQAFCDRVRKYVGAYAAVMGGVDGLVFGGGIGENSAEVRRRVCSGLEWAGLRLDEQGNEADNGNEARISRSDSLIDVWVLKVDEAAVIARECAGILSP